MQMNSGIDHLSFMQTISRIAIFSITPMALTGCILFGSVGLRSGEIEAATTACEEAETPDECFEAGDCVLIERDGNTSTFDGCVFDCTSLTEEDLCDLPILADICAVEAGDCDNVDETTDENEFANVLCAHYTSEASCEADELCSAVLETADGDRFSPRFSLCVPTCAQEIADCGTAEYEDACHVETVSNRDETESFDICVPNSLEGELPFLAYQTECDFPEAEIRNQSFCSWSVNSASSHPLVIYDIRISGEDGASFWTADTFFDFPITLDNDASFDLELVSQPNFPGLNQGTLELSTNRASPILTIPLSINGVE